MYNQIMQISIWGKIIIRNKIEAHHTVQCAYPAVEEYISAIATICRELDIPNPVVLKKHEKELAEFNMTRFHPDDFMEKVNFQRVDVEVIIKRTDNR